MKNKIFLTSALCMAFACPAFAVDGNELIENGDTCNNTNLGTYEGTANVEAIWTLDPRTCSVGQSYDSTTNTCITCTAGNYCPGGTFNVNSQTNGLNACPSGYALSESGAGADTDCYRQCATTDVAHSTGVSGGYYYGDNNQCEATSCAQGWHLKATPDLTTVIGVTERGITYVATTASGDRAGSYDNTSPSDVGISGESKAFIIDYGNKGIIKGHGRCSYNGATNPWVGTNGDYVLQQDGIKSSLTEEIGATYCYCQVNSYTANGSDTATVLSTPWIFHHNMDAGCSSSCAQECAYDLFIDNRPEFRTVMFSVIERELASCEANNIALKWYNDNTEIVPANSAAEQCTYNETITVPTNEPSKTGYTFGGWKLKTTTQN